MIPKSPDIKVTSSQPSEDTSTEVGVVRTWAYSTDCFNVRDSRMIEMNTFLFQIL
jgi:hypothetical protein